MIKILLKKTSFGCTGSLLLHTVSSLWGEDFSPCCAQAVELLGSVIAAHRLSCPTTCWILISQPRIESLSPALEGRFFFLLFILYWGIAN